jgi:sterol desaturase/sphingolipid hydroxylase (fatty acid hydroxylase superfamily)
MKPVRAALASCALAALLFAERRWPLRRAPLGGERLLTNTAFGVLAALTSTLTETPLVAHATREVQRRRWGLARLRPGPTRTLLGVLWLDYTLYLWHRAAHVQPLLWRLHLPHHLDPALDTTTAWRFHVLELLASAPFRVLQVALVGVPGDALALWRQLLLGSISFHHSNVGLPEWLDRALALAVMTPRLHGIHHSAREEQRSSNWSSGLSVWDRLHGTYLRDGDPTERPIGVDGQAPAPGLRAALCAPLLEPARPGS